MFTIDEHIYSVNDINVLLDDFDFIKSNKKIEYANVSCTIDIESSSFYENGQKRAIMYAFVLGINGKGIIGRTFDELYYLLNVISEHYSLTKYKRMIFYVHNLSYEFQFFRKRFNWEKVFAIDPRNVVYGLTDIGIEFRCSYLLSGYSLNGVGGILTKYKVNKHDGDLDYSKIRHPKTPLNEIELGYVLFDGLVVMAYIEEEIEHHGNNITRIPLTKTGKVRVYCYQQCYYSTKSHKITKHNNQQKYFKYRKLMNALKITSIKEYQQLKRAFHGGFTHANPFYVGKKVKDVTSYDFTSSYPSVMVCEQFPMSSGELITITSKEEFEKNLSLYCCLFDVTFTKIESIECYEHPISSSKCFKCVNPTIDNGRLVSAEEISTTLTEQDYAIIKKFYKWEHMRIKNFRRYRKGYLPSDFVKSILKLYYDKTTLKGVEGRESDYQISKENVNSCYGMAVTDPCRDELEYNIADEFNDNGGWDITECVLEDAIQKYNDNKRRFLFYPWGIWVTAYAERNLFTGIYECKMDYIYSDTDSIKIRNPEKHMDYINQYNQRVIKKLRNACEFHHIPFEMVSPKTIKGVEKTLGVWDFDGCYENFKTLGAKRYMVESEHGFDYKWEGKIIKLPYSLTVSGVNKKFAIPWMYSQFGDSIFEHFKEGLLIPCEYTGKNTHTYLDFEQEGIIYDYFGKPYHYHEYSSIHMEGAEYELSLASEFVDFLKGIENYIE